MYPTLRSSSSRDKMAYYKSSHSVSSKSRHIPNNTLARKPSTKPICMRRLRVEQRLGKTVKCHTSGLCAYEKTTLTVGSVSLPSSQKTAGFTFFIKKNGRRGKKKPIIVPWSTAELVDEDDWERTAVPALSIESIHCSSNARKCSSSKDY